MASSIPTRLLEKKSKVTKKFRPRKLATKMVKSKQRTQHKPNQIPPTLQGVTEAGRMLREGRVLFLPTETVYFQCWKLSAKAGSPDNTEPTVLLTQGVRSVRELLSLKPKAYAIDPKAPVVVNESMVVLHQIALRYWPGTIPVYVKVPSCQSALPTTPSGYVAILCPSHPLARKVLRTAGAPVVAVGTKARRSADVLACNQASASTTTAIHVLDGEDKREALNVPPCQLAPSTHSLWINEVERKVYLRGPTLVDCKEELENVLFSIPPISIKNRTILAVLRKWTISVEGG